MSHGSPPAIRPLGAGEASACERILRNLPDWFGIESSLVAYVKDVETPETFETWVAAAGDRLLGFITLRRHNPHSAEIHLIAVEPDLHRRGTGLALVRHAQRLLRGEGVAFFQVKTLGPSRDSWSYARTRAFYEKCGFLPLEENRLWGDVNPCQIMVMHLACGPQDPPGAGF